MEEGLTCTHACFIPRLVCRVVAVEAFVGVADVCFVAALSRLLGADLAAAAAVLHQAYPGGAGWHRWASARPVAELLALVDFTAFRRFFFRLRWWAVEKLTCSGTFESRMHCA